ncbi:nuclear transport factor 2 family protein [Fertoebacter nigrum]|uniref:Nuclear transport factor 2 family protein n=1 Tax=Fertoeibacter niger TaxID=2656921 RepID=A0A8X8GZN0_9RHOB|nr:SnoaL-like domain-containing protein [Fertoeibacter niger]NUB43442.1 nuclear transport factor 2 family protein [Fertoeibacter niger]
MTLSEIANELVAGCREGRVRANLQKLYAADAVSVEAIDMGDGREIHGLAGIDAKHQWWDDENTMTGGTVEGPFLHGDSSFAVIFTAEGISKADNKPFSMHEVAIYHVKDGKIVREEFFYN